MPDRRSMLKKTGRFALASALVPSLFNRLAAAEKAMDFETQGRIRHSVCRWCYSDVPLEELCRVGKEIGLAGIDLLGPSEFETARKMGIGCSMVSPEGLPDYLRVGFNRTEHHLNLVPFYENLMDVSAKAGFKNVICFSGNRNGMDDETGMKNMAEGIRKLLPTAEKLGVTLQIEIFNSKIDHPDYMADSTLWAVELCKMLGSENFKILYDIYHMQVQEGNVIATIKKFRPYLGHFHTAGVPGRHEIDESQELNYPAIMRAIAEGGAYQGFVAQEFIPIRADKIGSLREAVKICDI